MDERLSGVLLFIGSLCGLILYGGLMFGVFGLILVKVTAFAAMTIFLLILARLWRTRITLPVSEAEYTVNEDNRDSMD